ncbi:hypothetical protein AB0I27_06770 [Streptomyces sp. NPDC050597]
MKRRDGGGKRVRKRKPDRRPSLIDWLPVIRLVIEWLLRQG